MKRYKALLSILILMVVFLSLARTVVSNKISTDGVALGTIEEQTEGYKTQNLIYKEKVYTLSSLSNISLKAQKMGFVESKSGLVIGATLPIASR